jgi:hypothetical protein
VLSADKQALKRAFGRLVRAAGGQEAAVGFTRLVRHQALSDYANPASDQADRFAPADVIADLESVTHGLPGHPAMTRELARQAGFALVPLPTSAAVDPNLAAHMARIIRETSDVTGHLADTLATEATATEPGERGPRLLREIDEALQSLIDLRAALVAGNADSESWG